MNYVPAPTSVELRLSPSPEFSRYSKKVKSLGGRYSACRGNSHDRYVNLPWTDEGRELANKLVAEFGRDYRRAVLVVRGVDSFRGKHVHAHVIVHRLNQDDVDPCGTLLAKYEAAFLRAFPDATEPEPVVEPVEVDEESLPVTLTLTKAQARIVLSGLSRRCDELEALFGRESRQGLLTAAARTEALVQETKQAYQSIDRQVYAGC